MCSELDEAFNFWLEVFAFSECFKYESSWIKRINSIDDYWDTMLDSFDLDEFRIKFENGSFYPYTVASGRTNSSPIQTIF